MKKVILIAVLLSLVVTVVFIIRSNRTTEVKVTEEIKEITEIVIPQTDEKEEEFPPVKVEAITYNHKDTSSQEYSLPKTKAPIRQGWNYSVDSWETIDDELERTPLWCDIESIVINKYNLEDNKEEKVKGNLIEYEIYKFNNRGDVIEDAEYNSDGELTKKYIYKYDRDGNRIERRKYNSVIMIPEKLI